MFLIFQLEAYLLGVPQVHYLMIRILHSRFGLETKVIALHADIVVTKA